MIVQAEPDYETTNVPKQEWRKYFHALVGSNKFDVIIMICIVLNMFQMALIFEGATPEYLKILDNVNIVFTTVFLIEAILKLTAYGSSYFKNTWNKFDFIVVCASLFDILMSLMDASSLKFLRVGP